MIIAKGGLKAAQKGVRMEKLENYECDGQMSFKDIGLTEDTENETLDKQASKQASLKIG